MIKNEIKLIPRKVISDSRGYFLKVIDGKEENNPFPCEVYITSAKPGESKGGHYHKLAHEWFTVIKGEGRLELYDLINKNYKTILLSENEPLTVYVSPDIAHEFFNDSESELVVLAYTNQMFKADDTLPFKF